jgi:TonB-linked SusC/RagA family outer membrane protein
VLATLPAVSLGFPKIISPVKELFISSFPKHYKSMQLNFSGIASPVGKRSAHQPRQVEALLNERPRFACKMIRVMKLTAFFLLAACLQISAKAVSQQITLSAKNAPLKKVLKEVSRQAGISIVYDEGLISRANPVTISVKNATVKEVLDECLKNQPVIYNMDGTRIIIQKPMAPHQLRQEDTTIVVSGRIVDEKGEPVPGASVRIQGTNKGTATDPDGRYSIRAPRNASLVVNFLGYAPKTVAVTGGTLDVKLEVAQTALSETVVVGYGVQKKSVVTGSISSVRASDLENQPVTRPEQALQGRTSGVTIAANSGQPGSASAVRVRGLTTFGNNNPLWVVDGVVVDNGGIGYLNQYDIESIEVLKDAASQAIYGARAAAGVILVTTKKGKAGTLKVNYNGYYGISAPAKKLKMLNATEYATLRNEAAQNMNNPTKYPIPFADPASFGQGTDWQEQIFNNSAQRQNHEISVSGGNDRSTFYSSFGYLNQEGIVATDISKYQRVNARLNSVHKVSKYITFGQNVGYSYEKIVGLGNTNSEFGGPLSSALNLDPITPVVETDPAKLAVAPYNQPGIRRDAQGRPYGISTIVTQEITNPLAYITTRLGNYNWAHNIVGNAYLEVQPIPGLRFRSSIGTKIAFYGAETFTPSFYLNSSTNNSRTAFRRTNNQRFDWNLENTVSYTKTFGAHDVTVLLGQGAYKENHTRGTDVTYYGIPVDNFDDASMQYNVAPANKVSYGSEGIDHKVASLFARVNYAYEEKYLFTGIVRRDGSTRFGSNKKYGVFPSFSLGWVTSKENFWPSNNVVDFLKIRGGYGVVANDNTTDLVYESIIEGGRNYQLGTQDNFQVGYSPRSLPNPDLRWEQTSQTNVGFEATLFRDFIVSFDWYKKVTSGILQPLRIPMYVGVTVNPVANVADMNNTGLELELGYRKELGDWTVSANANVSHIKNEVTYLGPGKTYVTDGEQRFQSTSWPLTRTALGQPFGAFYGFRTNGIFQTQADVDAYVNAEGKKIQPNAAPGDFRWVDVNGDGKIDENDRDFIGNPTPTWTYGLTLNAAYKGFDLTVFGQGAGGNKIFQGLRRLDIPTANWQTTALGRWHGAGTSNSIPRLTVDDPNENHNYTNPSDFYLESGNYFRIRNLQLGYTIPASLSKRAKIEKIRVYIMAENLVTITKYSGYDPEVGGDLLGVDRGIYPQARSYMLGLNVTF